MKITLSVHTYSDKFFFKNDPFPLEPCNIDEKDQALKLLLLTVAVDLVLYLDIWVGSTHASSFL